VVVEAAILVKCSSCGAERTVSARQRRRHVGRGVAFRCRPCRFAARRLEVDDTSRVWWLRRFSDYEIARMAAAVFGKAADLEHLAAERERLAVE
jgi:hypothetical protein